MLRKTILTVASWLVGVLGMIGIFLYYQPQGFYLTVDSIGAAGIGGWLLLTVAARICANEATVKPLAALGFHLTRPDAFWISWIRTFANQITPFLGAAAYAHMIRRHTGIAWSQLAALTQPQIFIAAGAIAGVGIVAMAVNADRLGASMYGFVSVYAAIVALSLAFVTGAHWLLEMLPKSVASRLAGTSAALRKMASLPKLIAKLFLFHAAAVVLRGSRIGILFAAAGVPLSWAELMLLLAIAESALLLNITPGALGVREGAILAGAGLIGVPAATAASVALIDRLFMVSITTLLAAPAVVILRQPKPPSINE